MSIIPNGEKKFATKHPTKSPHIASFVKNGKSVKPSEILIWKALKLIGAKRRVKEK